MLDLLALSFLLLPIVFFFCCCGPTCPDCGPRARSILVTFGGTWGDAFVCGGPECANYAGSTYEVPFSTYFPYSGGNGSSNCRYTMPGETPQHEIWVEVFTNYAAGVYFSTKIRVTIRVIDGGCISVPGELEVLATEEPAFDCDADRLVTMNPPPGGFLQPTCSHTGGTALVQSP